MRFANDANLPPLTKKILQWFLKYSTKEHAYIAFDGFLKYHFIFVIRHNEIKFYVHFMVAMI